MSNHVSMKRIGIFYDGNYFMHVSNYYYYQHTRRARIDIGGFHDFIRSEIAKREGIEEHHAKIVDAHFFRGRTSASEANENGKLYSERVFDDILMHEGVITHYMPLRNRSNRLVERGIDVWLALECFEQSILKKFDVVVLIASDGDYVPLVRKLNGIGSRVMLMSWDFEWTDEQENRRWTSTSQDLRSEVSYPMKMQEVIDNGLAEEEPTVTKLFFTPYENRAYQQQIAAEISEEGEGERIYSAVAAKRMGYGFIKAEPADLYFYYQDVRNNDFAVLQEGDAVSYILGRNDKGLCARDIIRITSEEPVPFSNGGGDDAGLYSR